MLYIKLYLSEAFSVKGRRVFYRIAVAVDVNEYYTGLGKSDDASEGIAHDKIANSAVCFAFEINKAKAVFCRHDLCYFGDVIFVVKAFV